MLGQDIDIACDRQGGGGDHHARRLCLYPEQDQGGKGHRQGVQDQLAEAEPGGNAQPLCRFRGQRGPDGEQRPRCGGSAQKLQEFVCHRRHRLPGGRPGQTKHNRHDHRVLQQSQSQRAKDAQRHMPFANPGDDQCDQRGEHDQVDGQHHQHRPRRLRPQQDHQHRHAQKAGVADHRALRLDRRFFQGDPARQGNPGSQRVDGETARQIGQNEAGGIDFRHRKVCRKAEQHRRQRKVEDELGQVGRRLGREEPYAPGPVSQPDHRKEGKRLQKDRQHCRLSGVQGKTFTPACHMQPPGPFFGHKYPWGTARRRLRGYRQSARHVRTRPLIRWQMRLADLKR